MTRRPVPLPTLLTLLLPTALGGCVTLGPDDETDLLRARARWERAGLANYAWEVDRRCYCLAFGEATVTVIDGARVSVVRTEPGESLTAEEARWFPTVEELFDIVGRAAAEADALTVRYDPGTGAPLLVDIDWLAGAVDDEIRYTTTVPRPLG